MVVFELVLVTLLVIAVVVVGLAVVNARSRSQRQTLPPPVAGPGWYPDPTNPNIVRWFDGHQWTQQTQQRLY
ncbi:DUF2510 domain-containing protein [Nocardia sp. CA-128927]|uniref:DUF2510 domain-containing protein n=1 Tax=Nocardia sp. CA-128927 TaxID=3239975 RepID=UPI003D992918